MKDNKHIQSFNEHQENLNSELSKDTSSSISVVRSSENSTWDDIFERLAIKSNNFEEFWKECEKIKSEYIEPSRK